MAAALPAAAAARQDTSCCLRVHALVKGQINADYGPDQTQPYSGERTNRWEAQEIGLYEVERFGRELGLGWIHRERRFKSMQEQHGDLYSNHRWPDPPNREAGEPAVSRCAESIRTIGWRGGTGDHVDIEFGNLVAHMSGLPLFSTLRFVDSEGDCEHSSHFDDGYTDGLPFSNFDVATEGYQAKPIPLPRAFSRGLPTSAKLRRLSPFKAEQSYTVNHGVRRDPENLEYHVTTGSSDIEIRFRYFPRDRLKAERKRLDSL
jgi:hypothetical protein